MQMSPTKKCLQQIGYGIDKNKYHKLKNFSKRFALIDPHQPDVCDQGLPYKMYEEYTSNNCGPQELPHPSPWMVLNPLTSTWLSLFCKLTV